MTAISPADTGETGGPGSFKAGDHYSLVLLSSAVSRPVIGKLRAGPPPKH
jgi:hypothetical protein